MDFVGGADCLFAGIRSRGHRAVPDAERVRTLPASRRLAGTDGGPERGMAVPSPGGLSAVCRPGRLRRARAGPQRRGASQPRKRRAPPHPAFCLRRIVVVQGGTFMLVLSRKRGERIVIPDRSITITVVAVEGNRVRLGIAAPDGVTVVREELVLRTQGHRSGLEQPC